MTGQPPAAVVGLLRQGADAFNEWRGNNTDASVDLTGADLRGLPLDGVLLGGADLTGADLSTASLREAIFSGADLTGARFVEADLTGATFGPAELINAEIAFTPFGVAHVHAATVSGAHFTGATLRHTSFRECDLEGVDFRGCDLSTLDLRRSGLDGAITGPALPTPGEATGPLLPTPGETTLGEPIDLTTGPPPEWALANLVLPDVAQVRRLGSPHLVKDSDVDAALAMLGSGSNGAPGLLITGGAGMGKSALARRVLERLRSSGWAVTAVVGRWSPLGLFDAVIDGMHASAGGYTDECQPMLDTLSEQTPDGRRFEAVCQLLERFPLAILFDDLGQNLGTDGFLDPGFGELFDRLCRSAGRGRVLVTSRESPPALDRRRFRTLRLGPITTAADFPFLSTMDEAERRRVVTAVDGHPRSLQLVDAWLGAGGCQPDELIAALAGGAAPLAPFLSGLTAPQLDTLLQAAVLTVPVTADDLAVACQSRGTGAAKRQEVKHGMIEAVRSSAERLTELGLLNSWELADGDTVHFVDRWISEALAPFQGRALTDRHEGALNMHYARSHDSSRGRFEDYVAMTRHLVAVQGGGDLTKLALDVTGSLDVLEGFGTFSGAALLGEVAPSVPGGDGHHKPIVERLTALLIQEGFTRAACEVATRSLRAVGEWAPTHPQRDEARFCLAAAHDRHGMALRFDGRLDEARVTLTAAVDILHGLAAEHPTFIEGQRRLGDALEQLAQVYHRLDLPEYEDEMYETAAECAHVRTQLFQADPSPRTALDASPAFHRLAALSDVAGNPEAALTLLRTRHAMVEAVATAHPYDEELSVELASAATDLAARSALPRR
jgi:uncharacterized protein YjbI with pentapeptide repeats